ncbi:MAG: hypothetical protein HYW26_03445 [Candidatus Aenigmarchaeota archaeon]|nr:hypothetical protein [Candidatus Aenigmarchaeota archaeon]
MPYDEIFDLSVLDSKPLPSRCQYLTKPLFCMVGGEAHGLCFHEHFHTKCPFKRRFHEKYPHKAIKHPADELEKNLEEKKI